MPVRIGVDVGGTFTKAVACDAKTGEVVARSVAPTTHAGGRGVAEGVVSTLDEVIADVRAAGEEVLLVAHSTTQAVNALLEGDTAVVGVLGIGRRPDVRKARRRTQPGDVSVAPGRKLVTRHAFLDATAGLERREVADAIRGLIEEGAEVICASEAFGVEDARGEFLALEVAADLGIPACAGHELTGLYGLEMRTVTAALNAGILPTGVRTARFVDEAVKGDLGDIPLLVMRGDGGAADTETLSRQPLVTAFSGPAASVSGALRHLSVEDAVVVEVGGTSTNVSVVRGGRPVLSYVRVLDHVTSVRSIDVRVAGVAGGSLIRARYRRGRLTVDEIGPRSAHIAGLPYCSFATEGELRDAQPKLIAPRPGDPDAYVVLENAAGRRFAPTPTCAANALGRVTAGAYAAGDVRAARIAFERLALAFGKDWRDLATEVLSAAASKVATVVAAAMEENKLASSLVIGLGGGAGVLIPTMSQSLGLDHVIPADAEVISSVGDALSLIRVEVERTLASPSSDALASVYREAEQAAVAAGASPSSLQVESESVPHKNALRVVATGAVALDSHAGVASGAMDLSRAEAVAAAKLGPGASLLTNDDFYAVFATGSGRRRAFAVIDRFGTIATSGEGQVLAGPPNEIAAQVEESMPRYVRHYGPVGVAPALRVLRGSKLVDLSLVSSPDKALAAVLDECASAHDGSIVVFITRS